MRISLAVDRGQEMLLRAPKVGNSICVNFSIYSVDRHLPLVFMIMTRYMTAGQPRFLGM
jgi:hypothetical protein